jgi:TusA-related sulfurtransferase
MELLPSESFSALPVMRIKFLKYSNLILLDQLIFPALMVPANYGIELAHRVQKYIRVICLREVMPHKLDLRGAIVPFSLLKVIREFKLMNPGEKLEVFWSDPDTPADLFRILPDSSYELEGLEETAGEDPSYRITLVKKQSAKFNQGG